MAVHRVSPFHRENVRGARDHHQLCPWHTRPDLLHHPDRSGRVIDSGED
jgi:hypothetical protein